MERVAWLLGLALLTGCSGAAAGPTDAGRAVVAAQRACKASSMLLERGSRTQALAIRDQLDKSATLAAKAAVLDDEWKPMARAFSDYATAWTQFIAEVDAYKASQPSGGNGGWVLDSTAPDPWDSAPRVADSVVNTVVSSCRLARAAG